MNPKYSKILGIHSISIYRFACEVSIFLYKTQIREKIFTFSQGRRIRNIHEGYICYSQRFNLLVSHKSHESHKERIVTLAFAIRLQ